MAYREIVIPPAEEIEPSDSPRKQHGIDLVEEWIKANYEIRYNTMSNQLQCKWRKKKNATWNVVSDDYMYTLLRRQGIKYTLNNLKSLLRTYCEIYRYDPILQYFENSKWDGKERIDKLASYIHAERQEEFNVQFKKQLVRTIACALDENVFNKHCLVLVHHNQNSGKSSFMKWLCRIPGLEDYYTEEFGHGDKDDLSSLAENFVINLDELSIMGRKGLNDLKATFTKTKVKVRLPYDARKSVLTRRVSFFGSSNEDNFLVDDQNVRWLCFRITGINFDYHNQDTGKADFDVHDIWAEAYHLYKTGFQYKLTSEEVKENEDRNQEFKQINPEQELIMRFYTPCLKDDPGAIHMSATEILENVLKEIPDRLAGKFNAQYIGGVLSKAGFIKSSKKTDGKARYGYYVAETEAYQAYKGGVDIKKDDSNDGFPF